MSPFRIKDLMIDVLPENIGSAQRSFGCGSPVTFKYCRNQLTIGPDCLGLTIPRTILFTPRCCGSAITYLDTIDCVAERITVITTTITTTPVVGVLEAPRPEELTLLKAQLEQALANVEVHERVMQERLAPQTVEEVEALEQRMQAALEELQSHKARLQGGGEG